MKMTCLKCKCDMDLRKLNKTVNFKGVKIDYKTEGYICPKCGLESATIEQAGKTQRTIADAYMKSIGI